MNCKRFIELINSLWTRLEFYIFLNLFSNFAEKSVSLDSATPKSFYHQTAPPTPITHSHQHQPQQCHSQPPQSPAIQQLQQRSMSLQQHPHVQQQQSHLHQYFPAQRKYLFNFDYKLFIKLMLVETRYM